LTDCQKQLLELLDRSGAKLHALLTRLTLREDVAEELMQELFVKLSDVATSKKISNWDAYAYRAAVNLAFDWRRRNKPRQVGVSLEGISEPASDDYSPLDGLIRNEAVQQVLSAIGQLNGAAREAFVMRYIQQESYESIAGQLDKTPHQVRALCSKVTNYLRDVLGQSRTPSAGKEVHDVEN
jgi:RNA polymerase sigma factor (sigma-70 family)